MIDALLLDCEQAEGGVNILMKRPDLGARLDVLPLYDLAAAELARYRGLLVSMHADQRFLLGRRAQLEAYLAGGGTIVACGQVAYPFLETLAPFEVIENYRLEDLVVNREIEHPVWAGVETEDLTSRRGVSGFYGRGANPPPEGARVIHSLGPRRVPVDYEYAPPGGGRLLAHAGSDLWSDLDTDTTAARIAPQLLDWIAAREPGR